MYQPVLKRKIMALKMKSMQMYMYCM